MWLFLSILTVNATILWALSVILPRVDKALGLKEELIDVARLQAHGKPIAAPVPIPQYMVEWAMNESSEWAREDKIRRMRELYDRLGDWDKVKVAIANEEEVVSASTFS